MDMTVVHLTTVKRGRVLCQSLEDISDIVAANTRRGSLVTCQKCLAKIKKARAVPTTSLFQGSRGTQRSKRNRLRQQLAQFIPYDANRPTWMGEVRIPELKVMALDIRTKCPNGAPLTLDRFYAECGVQWLKRNSPEIYSACVAGLLSGDLKGDHNYWVRRF